MGGGSPPAKGDDGAGLRVLRVTYERMILDAIWVAEEVLLDPNRA